MVLLYLSLFLLTFIQLGITYYISLQTVGFILFLFLFRSYLIRTDTYLMLLVVFLGATFVVLFGSDFYSFSDTLRMMRELLCVIVFFCGVQFVCDRKIFYFKEVEVERVLTLYVFSLMAFSLLQLFIVKLGYYLVIPADYFVVNKPLFDFNELFSEYDMFSRVSLTYGEPSYFGLIIVGFSSWAIKYNKKFVLTCLIATSLIISSTFAVLSIFVIYFLNFIENKRGVQFSYFVFSCLILFFLFFISYFENEIIALKGDSAYIRLYAPMRIIYDILVNEPFGIPFYHLQGYLDSKIYAYTLILSVGNDSYVGFDNAFFNLIYSYGYIGFFFIIVSILFFFYLRISIVFFLIWFLFGLQSGSLFSFDKIFLILFFYSIIKSFDNNYICKRGCDVMV